MKIRLTPEALKQLDLVINAFNEETGFMIGRNMGKIKIIETILPAGFKPGTLDDLYQKIYQTYGHRLMGVYFKNSDPINSDWFVEDIVLTITRGQPKFYRYDIDKEKKLYPLADVNFDEPIKEPMKQPMKP